MNKSYIAVTVKEDELYYAYIIPITESNNIKYILDGIKGLQWANIFSTKKKAAAVAEMWNQSYKINGTYLFDKPF